MRLPVKAFTNGAVAMCERHAIVVTEGRVEMVDYLNIGLDRICHKEPIPSSIAQYIQGNCEYFQSQLVTQFENESSHLSTKWTSANVIMHYADGVLELEIGQAVASQAISDLLLEVLLFNQLVSGAGIIHNLPVILLDMEHIVILAQKEFFFLDKNSDEDTGCYYYEELLEPKFEKYRKLVAEGRGIPDLYKSDGELYLFSNKTSKLAIRSGPILSVVSSNRSGNNQYLHAFSLLTERWCNERNM